ncbi:MAG: trypsin-like serine protease [Syntrophomonadaceae bacterium]|nr:trypsin-like serine protease [Syntrophomonadaceae bacterium]
MVRLRLISVVKGLSAFLAGILVMAALTFTGGMKGMPHITWGEATSTETVAAALPVQASYNIPDVVSRVSPAVVTIRTTEQIDQKLDPFFNDPFFRQFYGRRYRAQEQPRVSQGLGSGFIISKDGYILTNEHVISGADEIEVTLSGGNESYPARKVSADYDLDLAVLKIDAGQDLPTVPLGNSNSARVGDWVIAIGNPYGLDHTVTVGVISAKGRPITIEDRQYENLLQTDASINPGNSGGPLLNLKGEVVGINTAINAEAQGIGFAIPSSTVQAVIKGLVK